jgi:hypothetical protein
MKAEAHPMEKELVMAYLDGELSPEAGARVASHLAECPECKALEAELRDVSSEMLTWIIGPATGKLAAGVNAAMLAKTAKNSRTTGQRIRGFVEIPRRIASSKWAWASAFTLVAVTIVLMVYPRNETTGISSSIGPIPRAARPQMAAAQPVAPLSLQLKSELPSPAAGIVSQNQSIAENLILPSTGPMIARTASLNISVKDFAAARGALDRLVSFHHGYAATMTINSQKDSPPSLEAVLQIPAAECDAALGGLKALGQVRKEQQGGEEVSAQVVDLDARLKNARITETRLEEILRTRTGKVSDVLEVEKEISDVRQNIEQMEAQQKELGHRVSYAAIQLEIVQEYEAALDMPSSSAGRTIRNAIVDGFHAAADGLLAVSAFFLTVAPSLLLAALILFWPARWAWRRMRQAQESN